MSTYYMKTIVYEPTTDRKEFTDYIEHLKKEHNIKIEIEESKEKTYYFGRSPGGDVDLYGIEENRENYNIEQCKLWHKKLSKEECKNCDRMECENAKKEINQT